MAKLYVFKQKTKVKNHPEQEKKQFCSRPLDIFKNAIPLL